LRLRALPLALAAAAAIALHLVAVFLGRGLPLAGTGSLAETVSRIAGRPEIARVSDRDPVRVVIGRAEKVPAEGLGPRALLDPASSREAPRLGADWPSSEERLAAARALVSPPRRARDEALAPLRAGSERRAGPPDWADGAASLAAVDLEVRTATRPLGARLLPPPSLAGAAETGRRPLVPAEEAGRLAIPAARALPLGVPRWPDPDRALSVPEVFVDVLRAGR
jgi:hypothetical protein